MFVWNYGTAYVLMANSRVLTGDEARDIFRNALGKIQLADSDGITVSFDGNHLVPAVMGMAQTHRQCEFTLFVKGKAEILSPRIAQQKVMKTAKMLVKQQKQAAAMLAKQQKAEAKMLKKQQEQAAA